MREDVREALSQAVLRSSRNLGRSCHFGTLVSGVPSALMPVAYVTPRWSSWETKHRGGSCQGSAGSMVQGGSDQAPNRPHPETLDSPRQEGFIVQRPGTGTPGQTAWVQAQH